jgi:hypothetical protein
MYPSIANPREAGALRKWYLIDTMLAISGGNVGDDCGL